jgi:serine/threonine-protein kinase
MIERFELIEEVGRGAMGVVWKGFDRERNKFVAIKMLRDLHLDDPEYVERFAREVDLARSVKSPHVVRVRGYGVRQSVPFVVLEFVPGQSLRGVIVERGPFQPAAARDLLAQTTEALAAVHAVGIVHRDIKASNVLLTAEGVAKLTDFGIARGRDSRGQTQRGSLLGTPAYMAPEGPADARSDIYSLGVLYYELLSGVLPFTSTHYQEVLRAHVETMPDLTRLPASERGLTGWLLSKSPAERPQSAAALLASLNANGSGARRSAAVERPAPNDSSDKYVEVGRTSAPAQPSAPVAPAPSPYVRQDVGQAPTVVAPAPYPRSGAAYGNPAVATPSARQPYPAIAPRPGGRARTARDNQAALIAVVAVGMFAVMCVVFMILLAIATRH